MSEKTAIKIYQPNKGLPSVEVKVVDDTIWLNCHQLTHIFKKDITMIGKHFNNVIKEGEWNKISFVAKFATTKMVRILYG